MSLLQNPEYPYWKVDRIMMQKETDNLIVQDFSTIRMIRMRKSILVIVDSKSILFLLSKYLDNQDALKTFETKTTRYSPNINQNKCLRFKNFTSVRTSVRIRSVLIYYPLSALSHTPARRTEDKTYQKAQYRKTVPSQPPSKSHPGPASPQSP